MRVMIVQIASTQVKVARELHLFAGTAPTGFTIQGPQWHVVISRRDHTRRFLFGLGQVSWLQIIVEIDISYDNWQTSTPWCTWEDAEIYGASPKFNPDDFPVFTGAPDDDPSAVVHVPYQGGAHYVGVDGGPLSRDAAAILPRHRARSAGAAGRRIAAACSIADRRRYDHPNSAMVGVAELRPVRKLSTRNDATRERLRSVARWRRGQLHRHRAANAAARMGRMVRAVLSADMGCPAIRCALSPSNTTTNFAANARTNTDRNVVYLRRPQARPRRTSDLNHLRYVGSAQPKVAYYVPRRPRSRREKSQLGGNRGGSLCVIVPGTDSASRRHAGRSRTLSVPETSERVSYELGTSSVFALIDAYPEN